MSNETATTAPAVTPSQPTAAVAKKQPSPMEVAKSTLRDQRFYGELATACPKILTPDRVVRAVLTATLGSAKLQECFMTSHGRATVAQAILKATQRGLEIDGRQGHLVPFFNSKKRCMEAQFIPGYQGLIDLAYRHPSVGAIWAEVVYDTDEFHYELGLDRTLRHIRNDEIQGTNIVAAYAVCKMKNSDDKTFVVLRKRHIDKIRAFSRTSSDPGSVWNLHPEAMWKKSAIRQLVNYIPQSAELQDLLNFENDATERAQDTNSPSAASAAASLFTATTQDPAQQTTPVIDVSGSSSGEDNISSDSAQPSAPNVQGSVAESSPATAPSAPRTRRTRTTLVEEPIAQKTVQEQLGDLVVELGGNFDTFVLRCIDGGHLPDSIAATTFGELPPDVCTRLLNNKPVVVSLLK